MPGVYLVDVIGDGTSRASAFRPNTPRSADYSLLALDPTRGRAMILAADANLIGAGIVALVSGATLAEFRAALVDGPTGQRRTAVLSALRAAGQTNPTGTSWRELINAFVQRFEPNSDIAGADEPGRSHRFNR
jgi:hypothetical protein